MKIVLIFVFFLSIITACSVNDKTEIEWKDVEFSQANFKVSCPENRRSYENISVNFDEERKTGTIYCSSEGIIYFVYTDEWNKSDNSDENLRKFFQTLSVIGVVDGEKIELNHEGKVAIQNVSPTHKKIEQHFLVGKRAYHLSVIVQERKLLISSKGGKFLDSYDAAGKLSENDLKIAQKFFDSFQILEK